MIAALLSQHGSVGKTAPTPQFATQSPRQGTRVVLIDTGPQGSALDWSEQRACCDRDCLFGVVGFHMTRHIARQATSPNRPIAPSSLDLSASLSCCARGS